MATAPRKIDSSVVGLRFTQEESPGVLPGSGVVWEGVEPNGYEPSGADVKTTPRKTLGNRKRQKGPVTGLDASLGIVEDFCQIAPQRRLKNLMMANYIDVPEEAVTAVTAGVGNGYTVASTTGFMANGLIFASGFTNSANNGFKVITAVGGGQVDVVDSTLTAEAAPPAGAKIVLVGYQGVAADLRIAANGTLFALTSEVAGIDFTTLPLIPGQLFFIGGDDTATKFATANNNGLKRAKSILAHGIVLDKYDAAMAVDAGAGKTIQIFFGRVLKDGVDAEVVPITDQAEQTLGAPDLTLPAEIQRRYFIGCVWDEMELEWPEEDLISFSAAYLNFDVENYDGNDVPKAGTRPSRLAEDAFSTTSDFNTLKLAVIDATTGNPSPLFVYIKEMTMTVKNNAEILKSLTVVGGFDVSRGTFEVDVEMNPYFTTIAQEIAIRQSHDVTLHGMCAKNGYGWAFDIPIGSLSGGLLEIEVDSPVMNPITLGASDGAKVNSSFTHTLLWTFFDYLPKAAYPKTAIV